MEKVVKRAIGYGKLKQNEDFTHVIYTESEYNKNLQELRNLENKMKKLERECNDQIERYKKSAEDKVAEILKNADERVAEARAERDKHKHRADSFENMNKNLIRVATERANAQRGLTPKKQHIGYVFSSIEQYIYNFECNVSGKKDKKKTVKLPCFRVRLQSPYPVSMDLEAVRNFINIDFSNKNIYEKLGLDGSFIIKNIWDDSELTSLWRNKEENFIFRAFFKANFQKGFWEIELVTRFMVDISQEMIMQK